MRILPYIEQKVVYNHLDLKAGAYAEANLPVRSKLLSVLTCPSLGRADLLQINGSDIQISDYAGCHHHVESPIDANNTGLLYLNSRIRFGEIEDGSSNTFLVGEKRQEDQELGWVSGTRATLRNTGVLPVSSSGYSNVAPQPPVAAVGPLDVGSFGSAHTGGTQFVFGDGSVRFISANIDLKLIPATGPSCRWRADGHYGFIVRDINKSCDSEFISKPQGACARNLKFLSNLFVTPFLCSSAFSTRFVRNTEKS